MSLRQECALIWTRLWLAAGAWQLLDIKRIVSGVGCMKVDVLRFFRSAATETACQDRVKLLSRVFAQDAHLYQVRYYVPPLPLQVSLSCSWLRPRTRGCHAALWPSSVGGRGS